MVSNGNRRIETDDAKDVTARTSVSWIFAGGPTDPHRQELTAFAWAQRGERSVDGVPTQRLRSGAGVHLEKDRLRLRAEVVHASGAIVLGPSPPFAGQPIAVATHGQALGLYVQARVRLVGRLLVGVRYDQLHRQTDDRVALRVFRGVTPMLEYDVVPRARLQLSYEHRWFSAPNASADAQTIADAAGARLAAQVTVIF
jgi:outer membrane receptor protein involved in Fe transport